MKKQFKLAMVMLVCAMFTFVFANVYATEPVTTADVTTEAELLEAIADTNIKTINITKDIDVTAKINITRPVTINGNSHKLSMDLEDNTVWDSKYIFQAYRTTDVVISDITLTGGNAGLLVNGSTVTLKGTIDVSGNGYGGIEVSTSSDEYQPSLDIREAKLVNTTEAYKLPTIWEDPSLTEIVVIENEDEYLWSEEIAAANGNLQWQYYIVPSNAIDTVENQIKDQIADEEIYIDVVGEDKSISKETLNSLKGKDIDVVITVYSASGKYLYDIGFNGSNIKEDFTSDLSLEIDVTTKQPFTSNVLKDVKSNLLYIDLEYSGVLPEGTVIYTYFADYEIGKNPSLYYYNEKEDKLELIKDGIADSDFNPDNVKEGYVAIKINHASTYIVSSADIDVASANLNSKTNVKPTTPANPANPNTSDMSVVVATMLSAVAACGFVVVGKEKLFNK